MTYLKTQLNLQLRDIEDRLDNVDDFKEWAILQVAKSNILLALQKYEN